MPEQIRRLSLPFIEVANGKKRWRVVFWVETTDGSNGRRARTFGNELDLTRWLEAAQANALATRGPATIGDAVTLFCKAHMDAERWDPKTLHRNKLDLALFAQPASTPLCDVNSAFVAAFLVRLRKLPIGTQPKRYFPAAALCKWLWQEGHIAGDPFSKVGPLAKPWVGKKAKRELALTRDERKPQLASEADCKRYLAAALTLTDPAERIGAILPISNGLRSGEIRNLRKRDIDFTAGDIALRGGHLKTEQAEGGADLPEILRADFAELCRTRLPHALVLASRTGRAHFPDWLSDICVKVCAMANLPRTTPHGLRRSYTTWHLKKGRRAVDISGFLGHGDAGQTVMDNYAGAPERRGVLGLVREFAKP